ncbi:hypothetical protein HZS_3562, partial [Henneguya salminicola]
MSWKLDEVENLSEEFPVIEVLDIEKDEYDKIVSNKSKIINKKIIKKTKNKKKVISVKKEDLNEEIIGPNNAWLDMGVPHALSIELTKNGFINPTGVQKNCVPKLIKMKNDSIVAAETGSGKTLAFIIPILTRCLSIKEESSGNECNKLRCLIVTPTRELAIQVRNMTNKVSKILKIFCIEIIGGLSEIKQERMLNRRPQIVVGTPGRLWTYMDQYPHIHFQDLSGFKLLVIDEVDRMTEQGHFFQLKNIIDFLKKKINGNYLTYIFSATLSVKKQNSKYKSKKNDSIYDKISKFISMSKNFKIFDVSNPTVTPDSLSEYKIFCDKKQINLFLYYILLSSGKTIIFVNSIHTSDWLTIFLSYLNIQTLKLNSKMDQKNRLKLYDKFNETNSILIATDVAARGLDIPNIHTVVHYNVPINPDIYVHRSGRTARQHRPGQSILLVVPESHAQYKVILKILDRDSDLTEYSVDYQKLEKYKEIVNLSSHNTDEYLKIRKLESTDRWFKEKSLSSETILDHIFVKINPIDSNL